jgi:hypothetical protein
VYVDDSGNEKVGSLWTALVIPLDLWTEYLGRWLSFRRTLYNKHSLPASFELHAQAWLAIEPEKQLEHESQKALARTQDGELIDLLRRDKGQRRARSRMFEKGLKTIGTFTEAHVLTVFKSGRRGKVGLYSDLLCFLEEFLSVENAHATVMVDGGHDSGGHLHKCHRALEIRGLISKKYKPRSPRACLRMDPMIARCRREAQADTIALMSDSRQETTICN